MRIRALLLTIGLACASAILVAGCGGSDSSDSGTPAPSGSSPTAASGSSPTAASATATISGSTPAASLTGAITVTNSANPVPFSGAQPDAGACRGQPNTWLWDQVLTETGGVGITITSVVTSVDNAAGNDVNPNLQIAAKGSFTRKMSMCFPNTTQSHTVKIDYKGTDANGHAVSFSAPVTTLSPK